MSVTLLTSNPVGRPTKMTDETLNKLRDAFLMGCSDEEACAYAEISHQTLYTYQNDHPDFLEQKEAWKQEPILKAKKTIIDALGEKETAKWYLERKLKGEFGGSGTNVAVQVNVGEELDKIEKKNKTDYAKLGEQARRQMVEIEQSVPDQGQERGAQDLPTESDPVQTHGGENGSQTGTDPQS